MRLNKEDIVHLYEVICAADAFAAIEKKPTTFSLQEDVGELPVSAILYWHMGDKMDKAAARVRKHFHELSIKQKERIAFCGLAMELAYEPR